MRARIEQELAMLREQYPDVEHAELNGEDWFRLPRYSIPEGWQEGKTPVSTTDVVFQVKANHPGTKPYGFLAPVDLNFKGKDKAGHAPSSRQVSRATHSKGVAHSGKAPHLQGYPCLQMFHNKRICARTGEVAFT